MSDLEGQAGDGQSVEQADAVAFLEAHLSGDEGLINYMYDTVDRYQLFAAVVGLLVAVIGEDRLAEVLREWRAGRLESP